MKIDKKTFKIHTGREIHLLSPYNSNPNITAGHDNKGVEIILGNGTGYQYIKECFLLAARLQKNEILHLPVYYNISEYKKTFCNFSFYNNIYLVNYCETQISPKEIAKVASIKIYSNQTIERRSKNIEIYVDRWKTDRKLTVKKHKNNIIILTNRDGFHNLAYGANRLSDCGDDVEYNDYSPHYHYDWDENTSKSIGITLYYWHNG